MLEHLDKISLMSARILRLMSVGHDSVQTIDAPAKI